MPPPLAFAVSTRFGGQNSLKAGKGALRLMHPLPGRGVQRLCFAQRAGRFPGMSRACACAH
eukprot:561788-Pelagomonas_calceolata.AAC.3